MCIGVFLWQAHPLYPFLLFLNRDEYHSRPTKPLAWWEGGEILGGKDELAGGTWLACTTYGRIAFITNVREIHKTPLPKSRGHLPLRFFQSNKHPEEFAKDIVKEAHEYNGFNLIVADIYSRSMVYITNRHESEHSCVAEVSPGMHVLSNASLDSPWPKAQRLGNNFKILLDKCGDAELPLKEMAEILMKNTIKDDESKLPHIYPPEWEHHLSSIFVDADSPLGQYGTRSTSVLSVKSDGEFNFYQKYLENEEWKEHSVNFHIEDRNGPENRNGSIHSK